MSKNLKALIQTVILSALSAGLTAVASGSTIQVIVAAVLTAIAGALVHPVGRAPRT